MAGNSLLIVDDNRGDVQLMLEALQEAKFPHTVVTAHGGEEALDYLFAQGSYAGRDKGLAPAMVLLDLKMPRINGFEVLRRMRTDKWLKFIPVVVFTSSDDEKDRQESIISGANIFLRKPADYGGWVEIAHFVDRLLRVLD